MIMKASSRAVIIPMKRDPVKTKLKFPMVLKISLKAEVDVDEVFITA